jgi:short-subunit dehydrogenase
MKPKLKKLSEQTIVITGASSGIGLETARQAVARGADVVLASRNLKDLQSICSELNESGPGRAVAVQCDVKNVDDVEALASKALEEFGQIDTWINNAGVTIFGKLTDVPLEEKREMFETNFWGTVYGCRSAVRALRDEGGAIINIGSVVSDRAVPIQGMYSASKHAVKAYTESLRMELEADGLPISVTLIKPAAIDTPYIDHGVNHMEHHPTHVPPVYSPSIVARAILSAAVNGGRDIRVGESGLMFAWMESFFPRLGDLMMERMMMDQGQSDPKLDEGVIRPNLRHAPSEEGAVRGSYNGHVIGTSPYTDAQMHPVAAALVATGLGLATAAGLHYLMGERAGGGGRRSRKSQASAGASVAADVGTGEHVTH